MDHEGGIAIPPLRGGGAPQNPLNFLLPGSCPILRISSVCSMRYFIHRQCMYATLRSIGRFWTISYDRRKPWEGKCSSPTECITVSYSCLRVFLSTPCKNVGRITTTLRGEETFVPTILRLSRKVSGDNLLRITGRLILQLWLRFCSSTS